MLRGLTKGLMAGRMQSCLFPHLSRGIASSAFCRDMTMLTVRDQEREHFNTSLFGGGLKRLISPGLAHRKYYFMRPRRAKGQLSFNGKRPAGTSWKKSIRRTQPRYKLKTCHTFAKRVKIVGPRHDRKFKVLRKGYQHLLRNKSTASLKRQNRPKFIHKADLYRIKKMLPLWKRQKFKNRL